MKRKRLFTTLGVACIGLMLLALPLMAACPAPAPTPTPTPTPAPTPAPAPVEGETIQISYLTNSVPHHAFTVDWILPYLEEWVERTDGRVNVNYFWSNSFCPMSEVYDSISSGIADIACFIPGANPGRFPIWEICELPFMWPSAQAMGRATWDLYQEFPEIQEELAGVQPINSRGNVMNDFQLTKPVHTQDDLKGLVIACQGPILMSTVSTLGGSPLELGFPDWYLALQRGTMDGYLGGWPALQSGKLDEFITYHTVVSYGVTAHTEVISPYTYNRLPADVRKAFDEVTGNLTEFAGLDNEYILDYIKVYYSDRGDEVYDLPAAELNSWKEQVSFLPQEYIDKANAAGAPGQKIYDRAKELAAKYADMPIDVADWWPDWAQEFGATYNK